MTVLQWHGCCAGTNGGRHVDQHVTPIATHMDGQMRQSKSFRRYALLALLAGALTSAAHVQAANDFEALLADVSFGQEPVASEPLGLEPAAQADMPADAPLSLPAAEAEPLPGPPATESTMPPAAIPAPMHASAAAVPCGDCQSGHCGGHHGLHHEAFCQPYVPPRLPTSTFYQYWRSNSCNVHVWDGFRNRCHQCVDLTVKPKAHHGCLGGQCNHGCATPAADCGPLPEGWGGAPACDTCD